MGGKYSFNYDVDKHSYEGSSKYYAGTWDYSVDRLVNWHINTRFYAQFLGSMQDRAEQASVFLSILIREQVLVNSSPDSGEFFSARFRGVKPVFLGLYILTVRVLELGKFIRVILGFWVSKFAVSNSLKQMEFFRVSGCLSICLLFCPFASLLVFKTAVVLGFFWTICIILRPLERIGIFFINPRSIPSLNSSWSRTNREMHLSRFWVILLKRVKKLDLGRNPYRYSGSQINSLINPERRFWITGLDRDFMGWWLESWVRIKLDYEKQTFRGSPPVFIISSLLLTYWIWEFIFLWSGKLTYIYFLLNSPNFSSYTSAITYKNLSEKNHLFDYKPNTESNRKIFYYVPTKSTVLFSFFFNLETLFISILGFQ